MPYVKSKLHAIYNQQREARLQASLWGHDDVRLDDADFLLDQGEISHGQIQASSEAGSIALDLKRKIKTIIGACYPWIHATNEGILFASNHKLISGRINVAGANACVGP